MPPDRHSLGGANKITATSTGRRHRTQPSRHCWTVRYVVASVSILVLLAVGHAEAEMQLKIVGGSFNLCAFFVQSDETTK
jgi:hypothetical protein